MAWPQGAGKEGTCTALTRRTGSKTAGILTGLTLPSHAPLKSVFKNYDPEGRGAISQEDFERLSGNFPFACHGLHPPPRQG